MSENLREGPRFLPNRDGPNPGAYSGFQVSGKVIWGTEVPQWAHGQSPGRGSPQRLHPFCMKA